jgi:glycosyltransferase involved in cell wall biosynthesis
VERLDERRERPLLKVLVVCSFTPFPAHRGDPVRVLGFLRGLAGLCSPELWCVESDGSDLRGLRDQFPDVTIRQYRRSRKRRFGAISDLIRYMEAGYRGVPSWILKRQSTDLTSRIILERRKWDAIIALGEASAIYLPSEDPAFHWDKFNVMTASLAAAQQKSVARIMDRVRDKMNLRATLRFEARMMARVKTVSVTNVVEADRIRRIFRTEPIVVSSSVVMPVSAQRKQASACRKPIVVWLGNLSYLSNRDGLWRFLREGWPVLQDEFVLRVVGSGMKTSDRSELLRITGVVPVGFVEDLADEMGNAAVGVVPLWSGGGTKMKTLTMMAYGVPLVSTSIGLEGIPWEHVLPDECCVDSPQGIANSIRRIVRNGSMPGGGRALNLLGEANRHIIASHFTEEAVRRQYQQLLQVVCGA